VSTLGLVVVPGGEPCALVGGAGTLLGGVGLLDRAVAALRSCPDVDHVLVVAPGEPPLDAAHAGADVVVLHDALFPLVDAAAVGAVLGALRADPRAAAAVAVLPVTDTLKQVAPDGAVLATVDRTRLRVAGSPQAYRTHLLPPDPLPPGPPDAAALPRALVEAGRRVVLVDAPPAAFRVRTDLDLLAARALLGES
jgi:2-C-methyl-D-erythritol 4-phosphate cytidylyltransferase